MTKQNTTQFLRNEEQKVPKIVWAKPRFQWQSRSCPPALRGFGLFLLVFLFCFLSSFTFHHPLLSVEQHSLCYSTFPQPYKQKKVVFSHKHCPFLNHFFHSPHLLASSFPPDISLYHAVCTYLGLTVVPAGLGLSCPERTSRLGVRCRMCVANFFLISAKNLRRPLEPNTPWPTSPCALLLTTIVYECTKRTPFCCKNRLDWIAKIHFSTFSSNSLHRPHVGDSHFYPVVDINHMNVYLQHLWLVNFILSIYAPLSISTNLTFPLQPHFCPAQWHHMTTK